MPLRISIRETGGVAILDLNGAIRLGEDSSLLRKNLRDQLDANKSVVLNFARISSLDSSAIGVLAEGKVHALNEGKQLRICQLPPLVQKLVRHLSLEKIIEVFETEAAALAGLQKS